MQRSCGIKGSQKKARRRSKKKESRKRRNQINLRISLVGSSLSLMFINHLEWTAIDRLLGKCILRNKLHSIIFMTPTLYSK